METTRVPAGGGVWTRPGGSRGSSRPRARGLATAGPRAAAPPRAPIPSWLFQPRSPRCCIRGVGGFAGRGPLPAGRGVLPSRGISVRTGQPTARHERRGSAWLPQGAGLEAATNVHFSLQRGNTTASVSLRGSSSTRCQPAERAGWPPHRAGPPLPSSPLPGRPGPRKDTRPGRWDPSLWVSEPQSSGPRS